MISLSLLLITNSMGFNVIQDIDLQKFVFFDNSQVSDAANQLNDVVQS
jgi:hypothetical protein